MGAAGPARLEFALTASVHFLFVLLTLGLVTLVAIMQTRYARTGDAELGRMTRFWGLLYVINYAVGIATGLVMEFQFGLNWRNLGGAFGDVFGAPLAMETIVAFVAESTLLGMWIFGWGHLGRRLHTALIWGVALTAYLSAGWVLVSNAFLQHPVGYAVGPDGVARLTSFAALLGNPTLGLALGHVVTAGLLTGGVFVAGVSAWHLRRRPDDPLFRRSLRYGLRTAVGGGLFVVAFGGPQYAVIDALQPAKLATGARLANLQADLAARFGPGDYAPPAWIQHARDLMMELWLLLFALAVVAALVLRRRALDRPGSRALLRALVWAMPLPFVAAVCGWLFREVGRQPWVVYGLLRTSDAASPMSAGALAASLAVFGALVAGLAVTDWWLLARYARRGPGDEFLPDPGPVGADPVAFSAAEA
ncbi:cytochrome ubiquinol oxidase subunit I [Planosporangium thailandense]|uniref:Cytochrome ubiquinol oxidase subunit I n=1 Tax=Planosporangium thailandense TaxID=765197 RepID=A0ABX0XRI8_9ACTN|nr:cytochrome ubiquinol oxidase subunit I [Planosporangium thailandense]NJC68441.1 cytochrome ubiquinol oxidase subunit I [Planosporangium thailandense]